MPTCQATCKTGRSPPATTQKRRLQKWTLCKSETFRLIGQLVSRKWKETSRGSTAPYDKNELGTLRGDDLNIDCDHVLSDVPVGLFCRPRDVQPQPVARLVDHGL